MSGAEGILLSYVTEDIVVFLSGTDLLSVQTKKVPHFLKRFSFHIIYILIGCSREN